MKATDISCEDTFKEYYSKEIFDNIFDFILEVFFTEDYRSSIDIHILHHNKTRVGIPQNPQHYLVIDFAYKGNVFHIDILEGISNGTEIEDFYYHEEKTKNYRKTNKYKKLKLNQNVENFSWFIIYFFI